MMMLLDAGNTRLKWMLRDGGRTVDRGALIHMGRDPVEALSAAWAGLESSESVWVANVLGSGFRGALDAWCRTRGWPRPHFAVVRRGLDGVTPAYPEPHRLGVDRYLAMVGGRALYEGDLLIADCGTAVTLDLLSADGRHHGGLVMPGLRLMRECLGRGVPAVGEQPPEEPVLLAIDTATAVSGGTCLGLAAAVDGVSDRLASHLGRPVRRLLTGGDAVTIMPWLSGSYTYLPDLVLDGLAHIAGSGVTSV